MTYRMEAVIPIETRFLTLCTKLWDKQANDNRMATELDPSDAKREHALI